MHYSFFIFWVHVQVNTDGLLGKLLNWFLKPECEGRAGCPHAHICLNATAIATQHVFDNRESVQKRALDFMETFVSQCLPQPFWLCPSVPTSRWGAPQQEHGLNATTISNDYAAVLVRRPPLDDWDLAIRRTAESALVIVMHRHVPSCARLVCYKPLTTAIEQAKTATPLLDLDREASRRSALGQPLQAASTISDISRPTPLPPTKVLHLQRNGRLCVPHAVPLLMAAPCNQCIDVFVDSGRWFHEREVHAAAGKPPPPLFPPAVSAAIGSLYATKYSGKAANEAINEKVIGCAAVLQARYPPGTDPRRHAVVASASDAAG